MKIIQIDETTLVQKKQSVVISTLYFLIYVGFFISFLYSLFLTAWISTISAFILSAFFALRWYSGSSYYTLQFPKAVDNKLFKITIDDDIFVLYAGSTIEEAELFAAMHELKVRSIEIVAEHTYSYL